MQVLDLFLKGKQTQERHAAELQSVIYMQWQEIVDSGEAVWIYQV